MVRNLDKYLFISAWFIFLLVFSGCAGRNYLIVDYRVPPESIQLEDQIVRLVIEDHRETRNIMTPDAAYEFPEFNGTYSLAWIMPDQERILAGEHRLQALFREAFVKRLTAEGIGLTDDAKAAAPVLTVVLKRFSLDLKDHRWKADLSYEAVLTMPGHPTARETVQGSAERVRIIGRKGADMVVSDIFSDAVNRLDLEKLFKNAALIR